MKLVTVTAELAPALAQLHAAGFKPPWSASDIAEVLASPGTFGLAAEADGAVAGFVLARTVVDESEILTIAVDPARRRLGLGRALLEAAALIAAGNGATSLFLEVDSGNLGALALYRSGGFAQVGKRAEYYAAGGDALVLRRALNSRPDAAYVTD